MDNEKEVTTSPPSIEDLIDVLLAISVVAKRLAKSIQGEQDKKEGGTLNG